MRFVILRGFSGSGSNWQKRNNNIEWKIGKLTHVHFLLVRVFRSPSDSIIYLIFDGITHRLCVCPWAVWAVCVVLVEVVCEFLENIIMCPRGSTSGVRDKTKFCKCQISIHARCESAGIYEECVCGNWTYVGFVWKCISRALNLYIYSLVVKFCGSTAPPTFQPPQLPIIICFIELLLL